MKNKKLLSALCLVTMVGCQFSTISSTPSSSTTSSNKESSTTSVSTTTSSSSVRKELNMEETLAKLQKGVKVESVVEETVGGKTNTYHMQTASKDKEFSYIIYKDETRSEKAAHEAYVALEGYDNIFATRLDVSNTLNYYKVYNPATYEYYVWEDGFNNAFASFSLDSFTKIDDLTYELKEASFADTSDELSTLLYGNPGLSVTSFKIKEVDDELYFESTLSYSTLYTYTVSSKVLTLGESVEIDYRAQILEEVEDEAFDNMIKALKAKNYKSVVENYDVFLDSEDLYISTEDRIYYETQGYKMGYYDLGDGTVQEVENRDGSFYKVGSPIEGSLDEVRPTFDVSRACFDKLEDGSYVMKKGVEGSMFVVTVFEAYAEELNDFTITINEDGYTFKNVLNDYETVVTFTDIGTADPGFTKDTVLEAMPKTSWESVLDADSYAWIVNIAGEEAANIPVPENYSVWYQFSEEAEYAMLVAEAGESIDDDFFAYYLALMDAGYFISEEEGLNGGIMALKEIEVNGEYHVLVVEFLEYEGMFCIMIYIGE